MVALTFLLAGDQVLEEVAGDGLVGRQVDLHLDGQEVVALPLRLVLRHKGLHVHGGLLRSVWNIRSV